MNRIKRMTALVLMASGMLGLSSTAQSGTRQTPAASTSQEASIRTMLNKQVTDWNRGDIEAFATGYKNSPDILFIGSKVRRGYAQMLAGYKAGYPPERMGKLSFSNLEVQPLDSRFATVTGGFALARAKENGGDASGTFLLVVEKTAAGWKIVRDDTTAAAPAK